MAKTTAALLPPTAALLQSLGERLRLARLRRRLTATQVAQRAGMTAMTLRSLERGGPGVTIGAYAAVMQALGIERDLDLLAAADPQGRELQDARLPSRAAALAPPAEAASKSSRPRGIAELAPARPGRAGASRPRQGDGSWVDSSGFASSRLLAKALDTRAGGAAKKRR